jgi:photosynthetic reaction center H subunit
MQAGAITSTIDVAQVALYAFWIFFFGLIIYLRKEDKREGYPLISDRSEAVRLDGFPRMPAPKVFLLPHGGSVMAPREEPPQPGFDAVPVAAWPGAPLQPVGDPMLAGVGPTASALRADVPDVTFETGENRVVPLRVATDHSIDPESPDPRNMEVVGDDGAVGGVVTDLWIDRAETFVRYLEVTLAAGASVLLPMPLAKFDVKGGRIIVHSIMGAQFADVPQLANPDQVTLREEDRIAAFYAGGNLFAEPRRMEPLL